MGGIGFDQKVPDVFYGPTALQRAKAAVEKGECARAKAEDERGYTYEVRRYEDGVACRRTYPLKVGDEVRYTRRTTGRVVEGTIYQVTTLPEHHADAGKVAYRLGLSRGDAEVIGHPVVIPHSRVELVWPISAIAATGFVLLHEGRRLGWKVLRGLVPTWHPDSRYYGHGPEAPPPASCAGELSTFTSWDGAVKWCASFPPHPAEMGNPPVPEDTQPERGPDDEVALRTISTNNNDNNALKGEE